MNRRTLALGAAVTAGALGLTVAEATLPAGVPWTVLGQFTGWAVVVLGLWYVADLWFVEQRHAPAPDPQGVRHPVPGDDADDALAEDWADPAVRARLRAVAVDVLVRETGCTPAEAREHLRAGTWTSDPRAASYLGADVGSPSVVERVRRWRRDDGPADRVLTELRAIESRERATEGEEP